MAKTKKKDFKKEFDENPLDLNIDEEAPEQPQEEAVEATEQHQELQGQDTSTKQEEGVQGATEGKKENLEQTKPQEEAKQPTGQSIESQGQDDTSPKAQEDAQGANQPTGETLKPEEPETKPKRKPGRPKRKVGDYELINISVNVKLLEKLNIAKAKFNDNLTAYVNYCLEQDLEAHFDEYKAFHDQLQALKAMMTNTE